MIHDCFMFHNEFDILEGRIKYLNDTVDFFVISESDITHSGNKKELNFTKEISRYREYLHKIIYLPFSPDTKGLDFSKKPEKTDFSSVHWKLENEQRNNLFMGLRFFRPDDIVLLGDVDEIPLKSAINTAKDCLNDYREAIAFEQDMFYYNFNQKQQNNWCGTVLTSNKVLASKGLQYFRNKRWQLPKITQAGYHLSYWNTSEKIKEKIESFAHQEYNKEEYTNLDIIEDRISKGEDLFGREDNPFISVKEDEIDSEIYQIFKKYIKEKK